MADENKSVHNGPSGEEQYEFVKQIIRPKKKNKIRKVLFTAVLAILFGAVSCIVFCLCLPLFSDYFEINKKQITIGKSEELEGHAVKTAAPTIAVLTASPTTLPTTVRTETPKPTKKPKATKVPDAGEMIVFSKTIQQITKEVNKSIVKVTSIQNSYNLFSNSNQDTSSTAGIIVGKSDKYLLIYVAASKVGATDNIIVTFQNNSVVNGKFFNEKQDLGIAIVAVEVAKLTKEQLQSIEVAAFDTTYEAKTGEPVLALGSPNGHMYSMEYGYISNEPYNDYIVDNAIKLINTTIDYNANGEGVLVNLDGKIIGFITHTMSFTNQLNTSVNTCYSIRNIKPIITKLVNQKDSIYFGITGNDITPEIAYKIHMDRGIYVMKVESNSPAFAADIKKGDVITEINGAEITNVEEYNTVINNFKAKDQVQVIYYRADGDKRVEKKAVVEVTIAK